MPIAPITDIAEARRALRRYLGHGEGTLAPELFAKLEALVDSPSPVDAIARSAELLYANRDVLDDPARTIAGKVASFAAVNGWQGMSVANRGGLILQAMERDVDAGAVTRDDGDPVPAPEYAPAVEAGVPASATASG